MLAIGDDITALGQAGVDFIHFDVMDGNFVPRLGLLPEMLSSITSVSNIPVDVHLMVQQPNSYIPVFAKAGAEIIAVHAEACSQLHRAIQLIRESGAKAGVALNPATPVNVLDDILEEIDLVIIMAINPGILGQKLIPSTVAKIRDLRARAGERENLLIEIDGGVTFENAPELLKAGANMLVCGSATIFNNNAPLGSNVDRLRRLIEEAG
jgi:ribulose-phosphate 3-epimerase